MTETKNIRNIALIGHSGNGKTTLAEAMLYLSGTTDRFGKTADGNTVCEARVEKVMLRKNAHKTAIVRISVPLEMAEKVRGMRPIGR